MRFLPDLFVTCPVCHGRQFNRQTLAVRYRDKSIADVLAMSIDEAAAFFENHPRDPPHADEPGRRGARLSHAGPASHDALGRRGAADQAGGRTGPTRRRARRSTFSTNRRPACTPTTSGGLLGVLQQLVDLGHTVLVIEHNLDVIKCADWVIDLGPEGGAGGGQIVVAGTPEEVAQCEASHTGRYLRQVLKERRSSRTLIGDNSY